MAGEAGFLPLGFLDYRGAFGQSGDPRLAHVPVLQVMSLPEDPQYDTSDPVAVRDWRGGPPCPAPVPAP